MSVITKIKTHLPNLQETPLLPASHPHCFQKGLLIRWGKGC